MRLYVGAGEGRPWEAYRIFSFPLFWLSLWLCAFFQPPFAGIFHVPTTCVAWFLHQGGSHVSFLPTTGKAFALLLPVMPALFFRLSTDPFLCRYHPVVQEGHQGSNKKSCGCGRKKEEAQMVPRVLSDWESLYRGDWSCSNYLLLCNKTPQNLVELKLQPFNYALKVVDGSGGDGSSPPRLGT